MARDSKGTPRRGAQASPGELFSGGSLEEAVTAVRLAFGPEAMILGTRRRRKYGLFGPPVVEVRACSAANRHAETGDGAAGRRAEATPAPGGVRGSLEALLRTAGVAPGLAIVLATNSLGGRHSPLMSTRQLGEALGRAISELVGRPRPVEPSPGGNRVVAFIGPHGAGKTTALVKVACELALGGGRKVAMVTADTHRLAAAEQLARYAAVLGMELGVAYTPGDLRRQCSRFGEAEFTLVDTPGHVWRSADDLAELGALLESAAPGEVHLVLPATRDLAVAEHAMCAYRPLGIDRLLVSRLDEAESYAPVVNLVSATKLPLSYLSCGPDVPGLLEVPDPWVIARSLLGGKPPKATRQAGAPAEEAGALD